MTAARIALPLAVAILIALMLPFTAHGDFFISNFNSTLIFTDHVNFYSALSDEPTAVFPTGLSGGPYGPLFYYPTAAWLWLLDLLHVIDANAWHDSSDAPMRSPGTIFALKLPNLAVYLAVGMVIAKTVGGRPGRLAIWLWLANPAVILFTLMMGQNDAWTALASVAALYLGLRSIEDRPFSVAGRRLPAGLLAMLCLAAGAAIKLSPLLLIPPFAWLIGRTAKERVLFAAAGAIAFVVMVLPFVSTPYFWDYGLFGTQAGKAAGLPNWATFLLYAAFLALTVIVARMQGRTRWALIFTFVAFHAFFFIVGGWSPQRSVLFIAALAVVVPYRRIFLLPYVLVTAYALLLALEHQNELASWLFAPLTSRVLLIPSLAAKGTIQPWHALLLSLATVSWLGCLVLSWRRATSQAHSPRLNLLPACLLLALPVYLLGASALLSRGVDDSPYRTPAPPIALAPDDTFAFGFISPQDDLRSISFVVAEGGGAASVIVTQDGNKLFDGPVRLVTGRNEIPLGHVRDARQSNFVVQITPEESMRIGMVEVPANLALASASLNGIIVPGTAAHSVHYETTWPLLLKDAASALRDYWLTLVVAFTVCAGAFAALAYAMRSGTIRTGQGIVPAKARHATIEPKPSTLTPS
jgi:hypothetical protein